MLQTLYILVLCLAGCLAAEEAPVADTKLGKYKGYTIKTYNGRKVDAFSGVRYAQPPIDKLRFKDPVAVKEHEGEYDATKEGEDCIQSSHIFNKYSMDEINNMTFLGSEDCLFLNIYTPNVKATKPYPVMVYIHGGGFMVGSGAKILHGPELLLDKDVILVTLNYRLGVFGFLAADDEVIPGNIGLKDQSLAIHWVRDNIASFGGDPKSITVFGESAGAAAVHFQITSPRNKGLIQRAISQSGSMDCPWAVLSKNKAEQTSLELATALGCSSTPDSFLICLQGKTIEEIMNAVQAIKKAKIKLEIIFKPVFEVKETGFITEKDYAIGSTIPWMTGVNSGEGLVLLTELSVVGEGDLRNFNRLYKQILPKEFNYDTYSNPDKITKLIKNRYLGEQDFSEATIKQFVNMFSDGLMIHGQVTSARRHQGENYFYLLTHQGQKSFSNFFQFQKYGAVGVHHADDLFYLFPLTKLHPELQFNEEDAKVKQLFLDMWTNFAIHGQPTPGKKEPKWYESENGKLYVTISKDGIKLGKHLYSSRMDFWDNLPMNVLNRYDDLRDEL